MSKRSRRRPAAARPAPPALTLSKDLSRWLAPTGLVVVTAVAYLPTLANGFVNFDDIENFINNRAYRGLGWTQLHWMFTTWNLGGLIPLTWITLGFDYVIWGMDPAGYHLTSLVLHLLGSLVFYFILLRLLRIVLEPSEGNRAALRLGALVGALLFSVHPLRVESVAWITERRDVLSGLFTFLSVLAYLRAWDARTGERLERRWYLASLAFFAGALLSKAMAVTLPAVLVLLDIYPLGRLRAYSPGGLRALARNLLVEKLPFGLLALACLVVTVLVARRNDAMAPLEGLSLLDRLFLAVHSAAFYLWKTMAPVNLSIMYELPERLDRAAWPFVAAWLCVIAISAGCLALARRFPALLIAWAAYLVMLAPVSGLVQSGLQMAADRYSYTPCLGWAALAGAGFFLAWRRAGRAPNASPRAQALVAGTAVCVIAILGVLTGRVARHGDPVDARAGRVAGEPRSREPRRPVPGPRADRPGRRPLRASRADAAELWPGPSLPPRDARAAGPARGGDAGVRGGRAADAGLGGALLQHGPGPRRAAPPGRGDRALSPGGEDRSRLCRRPQQFGPPPGRGREARRRCRALARSGRPASGLRELPQQPRAGPRSPGAGGRSTPGARSCRGPRSAQRGRPQQSGSDAGTSRTL